MIAIPIGLVLTLPIVFMLGMRFKWPFVLDAVRAMNKRFMNPRQMRSAGTPGAYAAVIHHVGRSSGRPYTTPVGVVRTGDEILITLPYGTRPDWLKNVLAAGNATIDHEGATIEVGQPAVIPTVDVLDRFPESDRRTQQLFAVDQVLRLQVGAGADLG
ncbi:MAG: nitroreductase family deazaflavin-dependent oxidoreductase [Acidimicrobiia bacterium]